MLDTGKLDQITSFPALIDYLRDQLDWPIEEYSFDDLTYEWDPKEFGLKVDEVAGQVEIKQLRPIEREPWGIFFLSLPHRKIPVTVLRRILGHLAVKKRASANAGSRAAWDKGDLLFIAAHGAGAERGLAFAHFHEDRAHGDLPTLNVLGWDSGDTIRRLSATHATLKDKLHWRDPSENDEQWRARWTAGFREKPGEVVATSRAMAKELARLAREIRRRANELLEQENDSGPLRTLHKAFKEALIHDLKHDDFADMYAQTIAYGLLSARISRESGALIADDTTALAPPTNPFLKELLETFLHAGGRKGGMDFDELGVNNVVEMLRRANMEAVLRDFDDRNPNEDPVIHFYELFLKEYDSKKRMQRGVFYTPRPVVNFIVRSVDEVLRTEFGLEDGLASTATWGEVIAAKPEIKLPECTKEDDPFVRILDPATGTGTFLVETVDLVYARMEEKWRKAGKSKVEIAALWNDYVPNHLLPRLYAFELMMAPYAIAHMKLGLKLFETGYRFGSDERARIYLTNALEPAQDFDMQLEFMSSALAHEAKAANAAKEEAFTVVMGNPPYSLESGNLNDQHKVVVQRYRFLDGVRIKERAALQFEKVINDDYVKFTAFGERLIASSGIGCSCTITSHGFVDSLFLRGMRSELLKTYKGLAVLDLHGNSAKQEESPEGGSNQNVFDIQQGVAITLGVAKPETQPVFAKGDLWGDRDEKHHRIAGHTIYELTREAPFPRSPKYLFASGNATGDSCYENFPAVSDIFRQYGAGFITARDNLVLDFDRQIVADRVKAFGSPDLTDAEALETFNVSDKKGWSVEKARASLRRSDIENDMEEALYRPFDYRALFYNDALVWGRSFPTMRHIVGVRNNVSLITTKVTKDRWDVGCTTRVTAHKAVSAYDTSSVFPLFLAPDGVGKGVTPNFQPSVVSRTIELIGLAFDDGSASQQPSSAAESLANREQVAPPTRERGDLTATFGPRDVFDWIYAALHSPAYRARYADYLKSDFARVPLPGSRELFQALVPLGTRLVALHLLDVDTAPELKDPKEVRFAGHGETRVEQVPAWTVPSGGRVNISAHRWFEGVPERVWNFHIGGYQPAQKWLKDRAAKGGKKANPGRILTADDQLHYRRMIVAMDKTIDLMGEIDRVIDAHGGWPGAFKGMSDDAKTEAAK
ncbi:DNA methyltransferase [Sphingomonas sp. DBB INV C78]|uniref:type ISP restriction/modification enzyme n=1 Tax=Sphingomonas sp. DBB INV C78 TaxID=3349434 RepID=UPI0036D38D14